MLDTLGRLLEKGSLSPHGICLLWRPELIWTHVISDAVIGLAYFSIPIALGVFVTRRRDIAFGWMFWSFAVFILACGTTHFLSIWTLWVPDYGAEAIVKAVTAAASIGTAAVLWPLLPRALALPSPAELRRANLALEARVAERDAALAAMRRAVAERERAEAMLRQSQKMEAIGQLTGGVAHDFNNLLGIVVGNLERIQRGLPEHSPAAKPARNAMEGAERAATLVQRMLAFARRQPLVPVELDANRLIAGLAELVRGALGGSAALATAPAADLWPVRVDANQLESTILNLAVNARDAVAQTAGAGEGTFTVSTRNVPAAAARAIPGLSPVDHVAIAFADTGCGMAPDVAERAVEPFFTTKAVGQGTGLGLSQVFGFVTQSGGHVAIASVPGSGTEVTLYLPRAVQGQDAVRETARGEPRDEARTANADPGPLAAPAYLGASAA